MPTKKDSDVWPLGNDCIAKTREYLGEADWGVQTFGVTNLRNGNGSVMLGGDRMGLQTVIKKGRNSPALGQLADLESKDTTAIALTNPLLEEDLDKCPVRYISIQNPLSFQPRSYSPTKKDTERNRIAATIAKTRRNNPTRKEKNRNQ